MFNSCPKVYECSVLCDESLAGRGGVGSSSVGGGGDIMNRHQHVKGYQLIIPEVTGDNPKTPQRSLRTTNHCMTLVGKHVKSLTLLHDDLEFFLI